MRSAVNLSLPSCLCILALLGWFPATAVAQSHGVRAKQRELTFAEAKRLRITTPLLHIIVGAPTAYLYAWTSREGKQWTMVFRSDAYYSQSIRSAHPEAEANRHFYALLNEAPRFVRIGTTGYYTGGVAVDTVEILLPNGKICGSTSPIAVGRAYDVGNMLAADGKCARAEHTAGQNETERNQVDAIQVEFTGEAAKKKYQLGLPSAPWQQPTFGVYVNAGGDSDPHDVPLGYVYHTQAKEVAFYDFSIPQSNNPQLFAEIRKLNPKHRIILRAYYGDGEVLDYFYDEAFRRRLVDSVIKQFSPNVDDFYGVALSEEELQHALAGWYSEQPQPWALKYQARFEQETGKKFAWHGAELASWLTEKCTFMYNDLYDQIKAVAPRLKVMPFLYVPGDISGWGWIDPAKLKKDGWVYQWYDPPGENSMLMSCEHPTASVTQVCVRERWFNLAIQQLRDAGVPNDEIYVQIWSYLPNQDPVAQTENTRAAGVRHLFNFYYSAWIPPEPVKVANPRDLLFRVVLPGPQGQVKNEAATSAWEQVGAGVAQSFIAKGNRVESISVQAKTGGMTGTFVSTFEPDDRGKPSGKPLATAEVAPPRTGDWLDFGLKASVEEGKHYWICLRPKDDKSAGLQVAVSQEDTFRDGELLPYQIFPGDYFRGWRVYSGDAFGFAGPSDTASCWRASYNERLAWEQYISEVRQRR